MEPERVDPAEPGAARPPRLRLTAVLVLALLVAFGVWMLVRGSDDESAAPPTAEPGVRIADLAELLAVAAAAGGPVYWAGPRPGLRYELSQTASGRIFVRYLPPGVEAGDPSPGYLTVGTYPAEDALEATRRLGEEDGAVTRELPGGGIAVYNESTPTSVYLAFPGVERQVEVYDPSAKAARQVAYSGAVTPLTGESEDVPPEQAGRPVAATQAELEELAAELGHPLYWTGPRPGHTYELTRLPNGQVFIRYLPEGVEVGDGRPEFETVGTYPLPEALSAIERAASAPGAVGFALPAGGRGYYHESKPTSVYFALPESDLQVEVFHPDAARAQELVRSGAVVPIR